MREVICTDALPWLAERPGTLDAIITSPPDAAELGGMAPAEYRRWLRQAAALCLQATQDSGPCIFYVTDRKAGGVTVSKAHLLLAQAGLQGYRLLWHKIVLRRPMGSTDLHRPGYSHLMAFSRTGGPGTATPDVIEGGGRAYSNGMAFGAARAAVAHAVRTAGMVADPFCGRGTVLAAANLAGLPATGVDIDPEQCRAARALEIQSPLAGVCS